MPYTLAVHLARLPVLQVLKERSPLFGIIAKRVFSILTGGNGAVVVGLDVAKIQSAIQMEENLHLMTTVDLRLHKVTKSFIP